MLKGADRDVDGKLTQKDAASSVAELRKVSEAFHEGCLKVFVSGV